MPVALTLPPGLSPGVVAEEPAEPPFPPAPEPPKSEPATPCPPPSEGLSSAVPEHASSGLAARTFRNVRRLLLTRVPCLVLSCLVLARARLRKWGALSPKRPGESG